MKTSNALKTNAICQPSPHLLDTIGAIRASIGDGLNDDELTRLMRQATLLNEAGFSFLSFSHGFVTLTVPHQDLANWYPDKGWIVPEKERIARAIAEKYGLSLCEPPNDTSSPRFLQLESPPAHHHLELVNRRETIIVAHPNYLKVRLLGTRSGSRYLPFVEAPLPLGPDLLHDLSALYQS
jgi:hypothetical protein